MKTLRECLVSEIAARAIEDIQTFLDKWEKKHPNDTALRGEVREEFKRK